MYRGRFAPSPTGSLHLGSLVSALSSFLDAKANNGKWLLRIEDIDPPREEPGAKEKIILALEKHQLFWDEEITYQSHCSQYYDNAIKQLKQQGDLYPCCCSSKKIKSLREQRGNCPCRNTQIDINSVRPFSWRLKTDSTEIAFADRFNGKLKQNIGQEVGDFTIVRSDGLYAYQLAVVVDDARQKISHIVRGEDLLPITNRQIYLQQKLSLTTPIYAHTPLVLNKDGNKLSKQTFAPELNLETPFMNLTESLKYLKINVPQAIFISQNISLLLEYAIEKWQLQLSKL